MGHRGKAVLACLLCALGVETAQAQPFIVDTYVGFPDVSADTSRTIVIPAHPLKTHWTLWSVRPTGDPRTTFDPLRDPGIRGWLSLSSVPEPQHMTFRADAGLDLIRIRANLPFAWEDLVPDSVHVHFKFEDDTQLQGRNANVIITDLQSDARLLLLERATTHPIRFDLHESPFSYARPGTITQVTDPTQRGHSFEEAIPVVVQWNGKQMHAWQGQRLELMHADGRRTDVLVLVSQMVPTAPNMESAPFRLHMLFLTYR
jgi:hypothetical protein